MTKIWLHLQIGPCDSQEEAERQQLEALPLLKSAGITGVVVNAWSRWERPYAFSEGNAFVAVTTALRQELDVVLSRHLHVGSVEELSSKFRSQGEYLTRKNRYTDRQYFQETITTVKAEARMFGRKADGTSKVSTGLCNEFRPEGNLNSPGTIWDYWKEHSMSTVELQQVVRAISMATWYAGKVDFICPAGTSSTQFTHPVRFHAAHHAFNAGTCWSTKVEEDAYIPTDGLRRPSSLLWGFAAAPESVRFALWDCHIRSHQIKEAVQRLPSQLLKITDYKDPAEFWIQCPAEHLVQFLNECIELGGLQ